MVHGDAGLSDMVIEARIIGDAVARRQLAPAKTGESRLVQDFPDQPQPITQGLQVTLVGEEVLPDSHRVTGIGRSQLYNAPA